MDDDGPEESLGEASRGAPERALDHLSGAVRSAVVGEVLPRLVVAAELDRERAASAGPAEASTIEPEDRQTFLDIVCDRDTPCALAFIDILKARGVPLEDIYVDLMAGAAHRLGQLWEEDAKDFTEVTLALCRLHEILRNQRLSRSSRSSARTGAVLLTTAAGNDHIFGAMLVAEFFRQSGWRVRVEPGTRRAVLRDILSNQHFDVVGVSIAATGREGALADEIGALRSASRNLDLRVLVGGRVFSDDTVLRDRDSYAEKLGADAWSADAKRAPEIAGELLAQAVSR